MISALADGGWTPGLAPLRRAAWPGTLDLARVPDRPGLAADSAAPAGAPTRTSLTLAARGGGFVADGAGRGGDGGRPRVNPPARSPRRTLRCIC